MDSIFHPMFKLKPLIKLNLKSITIIMIRLQIIKFACKIILHSKEVNNVKACSKWINLLNKIVKLTIVKFVVKIPQIGFTKMQDLLVKNNVKNSQVKKKLMYIKLVLKPLILKNQFLITVKPNFNKKLIQINVKMIFVDFVV